MVSQSLPGVAHSGAIIDASPSAAVFEARDGLIHHRGVEMHWNTVWNLLRDYDNDAAEPSWHQAHDREMATLLRRAIAEANPQHEAA